MKNIKSLVVFVFVLSSTFLITACGSDSSNSTADISDPNTSDGDSSDAGDSGNDDSTDGSSDDESSETNQYSYDNEAWFTLRADACDGRSDALSVYNLINESDLSSENFSCTQENKGSEIVYSISWSGDDFDRDGIKDTLNFDVSVEAFNGTTYSYSVNEGASSVTELGSQDVLYYATYDSDSSGDDDTGYWDVSDDQVSGIAAGQSLRFSIGNITVSADGYEAQVNGFNAISLLETAGGREHSHIRGFGTGLDSGIFDTPDTSYRFDATETFTITGSGDYYDQLVWSMSDIQFSFSISAPELQPESKWLSGSWGVAHVVDGGFYLDDSAENSDFVAGAEQIVANLSEAGHVITFFTHPAHPHLYTLRENPNVDIAEEINPNMVPSLKNEQIILDVIDTFRAADKKVILYLNAAGPSSNLYNDNLVAISESWEEYYTSQWDGDEGAAWRNLVQGFAKRFDGLVDGYWFDNASDIPGGSEAFVQVFRDIDPDLYLCLNLNKQYHQDENGEYIEVDSDGIDDEDSTDYKVIKYVPTNQYDDYSCGHVTPLGNGAPPNSFAYEEYTIPAMVESNTATYDGYKYANKHAWFPIRKLWHVASADLVFEQEQAYRFVRSITDGGAAMTWSNTQVNGMMSEDEMAIMKEINDRLVQQPVPDYEAYQRPEGACYVGECEE